MRVLQVMASGAVGGGLDHLLGLVSELVAAGHDCHVALGADGPGPSRARELGVPVTVVDLMGHRLDPRAVWQLRQLHKAVCPDLIHYHGTRAGFFGAGAALPFGTGPAVYTAHGLAYRQERGVASGAVGVVAEAIACRGVREVITVAAADRRDLIRRGLVRRSRCHHLPNAVDTERFSPGDRAAARERTGLPAEAFIVGTVARLVPQKAVGDLIRAVARCPGVQLVIAGEGPERAALGEQASRDCDGRVHFLGTRDDVPDLLRAFDLFALSSRWEGEPVALIEAMASGVACVATATDGSRELLGEGKGLLVEVGQPDGLASAITDLSRDPGCRARLGAEARRAVRARSYATHAARVIEVYEKAAR